MTENTRRTLGSTLQLEKPSWEQCSHHTSVQLWCGDTVWWEHYGQTALNRGLRREDSKEVLWLTISPPAECTLFSHLSQPVFASSWTVVLHETTSKASICLQTSRFLFGNGLPGATVSLLGSSGALWKPGGWTGVSAPTNITEIKWKCFEAIIWSSSGPNYYNWQVACLQ